MKTKLIIISLLFSISVFSQSQHDNLTGEYINGIYYYNRLDFMRSSYDRWQGLMKDYHPGEDVKEYNFGIYSAMNDFNIGQDVDGNKISPMLIGYALGKEKLGYYFLLSSTDVGNMLKKDSLDNRINYNAITFGLNYQTKYFSLMSDVTLANSELSVYGKIYFPFLKSHIGIGSSPFDEIVDPISNQKKIIRSNLNFDQLDFNTSILQYATIGLKLLKYTKTRYMPNISTSAHAFVKRNKWADMKYDAELFFETRGEKWDNFFDMQDFDVRFVLYRLLGDAVVDVDGICLRYTIFGGVSYKSEVNYFTQTITESGLIYNGQNGLGFELGGGLRVLGFKKYGFQEDTYVRLSYFYNYSQYFERFSGLKQGLKFKVMF